MNEDITSIKILKEYIKADLTVNDGKRRSCGYKYLKWVRISRYFYLKKMKMLEILARMRKNYYGNRFGFDINYKVPCGKKYSIIHNTGVIFFPNSAGSNMRFRNFVVVGEKMPGSGNPIIGDNVSFGTGCKVLGPIHIGNNVIIGANAVVVHDVPDNSVVAGIPAKVIRKTKDIWGTPFEE